MNRREIRREKEKGTELRSRDGRKGDKKEGMMGGRKDARKGGHDRVEIKLTSKCFKYILKLQDVLRPDGKMI